jgi:hypothetical protein
MSWDQVILLYDVERTPEGFAKIVIPEVGERLTVEQLFRRRYFLLGITSQDIVDQEWKKYKAKREEENKKDPKKRAQRELRRMRASQNG